MKKKTEIVFVSGLPCSGKSFLTKRLVEHLGGDCAARLPMDHYFQDAIRPEHTHQHSMPVYQRERLDWHLLFHHLEQLRSGRAIDTPKYDWGRHKRVPSNSGIGRTCHIEPVPVVFVDGLHPSMDPAHKHIYVAPSWEAIRKLIRIRSGEMPVPDHYETILRQVEQSPYGTALSWLSTHCWRKVDDPFDMDVGRFCRGCKWFPMPGKSGSKKSNPWKTGKTPGHEAGGGTPERVTGSQARLPWGPGINECLQGANLSFP